MGTLWDFSTSILSQNSERIEGGLLGKNFPKRKKGPFGLVRYCMLRGKPFWTTTWQVQEIKVVESLLKKQKKMRINITQSYPSRFLWQSKNQEQTSRDRRKSALYLKNSKRTSKCLSILFYSTQKIFSKKVSQRQNN